MKRVSPTKRSSCWCVWPATTSGASTPASAAAQRAGVEIRVRISSSLGRRGVAEQDAVEVVSVERAVPGTRRASAPVSHAVSAAMSSCERPLACQLTAQRPRARRCRGSVSSAESGSPDSAALSAANGPGTASPPTTTASGPGPRAGRRARPRARRRSRGCRRARGSSWTQPIATVRLRVCVNVVPETRSSMLTRALVLAGAISLVFAAGANAALPTSVTMLGARGRRGDGIRRCRDAGRRAISATVNGAKLTVTSARARVEPIASIAAAGAERRNRRLRRRDRAAPRRGSSRDAGRALLVRLRVRPRPL